MYLKHCTDVISAQRPCRISSTTEDTFGATSGRGSLAVNGAAIDASCWLSDTPCARSGTR